MHIFHKRIEDDAWPAGLTEPGLRERAGVFAHRTCQECGRGQVLKRGYIGSPSDPFLTELWKDDDKWQESSF